MRHPLDVPSSFGETGWSHNTVSIPIDSKPLTKDQAIARTRELNARHMADSADCWAVAVELAEPQGDACYSLECGPESMSMVLVTKHLPARIYRDEMGGKESND